MSLPQTAEELRGLCVDEVGMKLLKAADVIRERGWCQGAMYIEGRVCALGAIVTAYDGEMTAAADAEIRFSNYLHKFRAQDKICSATSIRYPARWNDHPSRTVAEVIAALTQAAFASVP